MTTARTTDALIQRSAWYEAFSLMFRFPDEEGFPTLSERIATLPADVLDPENRDKLAEFQKIVAAASFSDFRAEYSRLFSGAGVLRANQNDYERLSFSMTERLADVAGFYTAFGFEMSDEAGERPDFIGTELEFVRLLLLKQAYAVERHWPEQAEITEDGLNKFISKHIVGWVPMLCTVLQRTAPENGVFSSGSVALRALVDAESKRVGDVDID